ncbi:uncharacterized protein [Periplaneta americana]|uniref:uncharacterized protein isoform X2 n=1 Tax=Periplaneta americana TaxID=6978 RepID=UPI0037E8CBEF
MDVIKTEPDIDPLDPQSDRKGDEKNPLSMDRNLLDLDVNQIKVEPPDSCDVTSDIKCETNDVPATFSVLKCDVEEESCNVDAVEVGSLPDMTEDDNGSNSRRVYSSVIFFWAAN